MRLLVITQKVDVDDDVLGFFHNWLCKLAPLVTELHVIANAVGKHELPENVHVYSLGKEHGYGRARRVIALWRYASRILRHVDGVFVHMCPEYVRAINPINLFFKKPIIMWYAHVKVVPEAAWASKKVQKILSPSAESFVFDTRKLLATGHGIDTSLFAPGDVHRRPKKHILAISRVSRIKDIGTLVEAVRVLVGRGVRDIAVSFYGQPARPEDHQYFADLKKKVEEYGLTSYFEWKGSVRNRDAPDVYRDADIFVRMQPGGGFGKTELEAMACSIPAITPTPVYRASLGEFADDLFFKEGNAEDLADKIVVVMGWNAERLEKYRTLARTLVEKHHNLDNVARSIVGAFKL